MLIVKGKLLKYAKPQMLKDSFVICESSQELEADHEERRYGCCCFPHFQGYCTFFTGGMLNILANFCHSWNARRRRPRIKSPKARRAEWQA